MVKNLNKGQKGGPLKKKTVKKLIVLLLIATVVMAIKITGLHNYLTLSALKGYKSTLDGFYQAHGLLVMSAYFLAYVVVTALSIPGAAVMTLAGGALFGLLKGTVIVSFASSLGATLAFLVSRFLLRDWVQERFGDRLETINKGIEREGALYLFTLRLVPIFPFFVINLLMGLTSMRTGTFYLVSQLGMLPGTIVYVNAGRELARIQSLSDIMSARLIAAFVMLGLLPLVAKRFVGMLRSRARRKGHGQI